MGSQCYLPPGRGDIPALTQAEAGTRLSDPEGCKAELTLAGYIPKAKTVTHPGTNRARRALTSFMRRTPLTTTPRRQHDAQHRAVKTSLRGRGSSAGQINDGVRIVVARAALSHSEVIVFLNESVGRRREAMTSIHRYAVTRTRPIVHRARVTSTQLPTPS